MQLPLGKVKFNGALKVSLHCVVKNIKAKLESVDVLYYVFLSRSKKLAIPIILKTKTVVQLLLFMQISRTLIFISMGKAITGIIYVVL